MTGRYRKSGCIPCKKSHKKCDELRPKCTSCAKRGLECDYGSLFVQFNSSSTGNTTISPSSTASSSPATQVPMKGKRKKNGKNDLTFEHYGSNQDAVKHQQQAAAQLQQQFQANQKNVIAKQKAKQEFAAWEGDSSPGIMSKPMMNESSTTVKTESPPFSSTNTSVHSPLPKTVTGPPSGSFQHPQLESSNSDKFLPTAFADDILSVDLRYLETIFADENRSLTPIIPTEHVESESLYFNWDQISPEDLSKIIELNDPFLKNPNLPYDDPKAEQFINRMWRETKCFGNYIYFSGPGENILVDNMELLAPSYPILKHLVYVITGYGISVIRPQDVHWSNIKNEYLKYCISSLIKNINTHHPFELTSLLTVVILFYSVDTSTTANAWRKHLNCAFALIQRFDSFFPSEEQAAQVYDPRLTKAAFELFRFLKDTFVYAESLAWISAPGLGIAKNLEEIDYLFARDSYCKPNLIDHLILVKGSTRYLTSVFAKIIRILLDLKLNYNVVISGANCVFHTLSTDKYHLEATKLLEELNEIDHMKLDLSGIADEKQRATLYLSNKAFIAALKLFISITFLKIPIYSPQIQNLTRQIADCAEGMPYAASQSVGIHWPMFIGALCSQPGPSRSIFVAHLTDIVEKGMTVATYTLNRLNHAWDCMATGQYFDESQWDHIAY